MVAYYLMKFRSIINSIGSWFEDEWHASKFDFLPGKSNFLESTWYGCIGWKKLRHGRTTLQYLDYLVKDIETKLSNPRLSVIRRPILEDFNKALYHPGIREEIVLFLNTAAFSWEDSQQLWEKIHAAWRTPAASTHAMTIPVLSKDATGSGVEMFRGEVSASEVSTGELSAGEVPAGEVSAGEVPVGEVSAGEVPAGELHAKTYAIAAHISFELAGKEPEFEALSHDLALLDKFIREQFRVKKLPGTFSNLKGYSYKRILEGKNISKKGQLKPCLRQIFDHPQVFGEDISHHARQLFNEHFEN